MALVWTKDDEGRWSMETVGLTWADVKGDYPNGVRRIDWPRFSGGCEISYRYSIMGGVDEKRGPWEYGVCRYCGVKVTLRMMEPFMCPVGPEWMAGTGQLRGADD